eukprot:m.65851 g.65851  ORF g.65851 m.65851 type:complete len:391 (-) comp11763_c0_seq1:56-1228(-)
MDKSSEKWVLLLMVYLGMKIGQCDGDQAVKPQLTSFFYAFYDDTLDWNQSMWNKEMEALRDIQIQSIIVRSVMTEDSMGIVQRGVENCSQIPYLGVFRAFYASSLPCTTHVSDALDKLLIAAATVEIKVYLGLSMPGGAIWKHMNFSPWPPGPFPTESDARVYYKLYTSWQKSVFSEVWSRYGAKKQFMGVYIGLEVGNTVEWVKQKDLLIDEFFKPLCDYIKEASNNTLITTTSPSYFFSFIQGPPVPVSPDDLAEFYDGIYKRVPSFDFIAPKDGMGASENNVSIVTSYLTALAKVSKENNREIWSNLEIFSHIPSPPSPSPAPPCAYGTIFPADMDRIEKQLNLEHSFVSGITSWEFHAFMSPYSTQCQWHDRAKILYQNYSRYIKA